MKKLIKVILVVGLLALTAGTTFASDYGFGVKYKCVDQGGYGPGFGFQAIDDVSRDGLDLSDYKQVLDLNSPHAVAAIYKINGVDGWDSDNGYYDWESRSVLQPGQTKVFNNIYFWAMSGTTVGDMYLSILSPGGASIDPRLTYKLFLVSVPNGVTYNGATEWTSPAGPLGYITLPFYSTTDPSTGYKFRVEVTAVPEPSSVVGLLGSLMSLATTVVIRRRGK